VNDKARTEKMSVTLPKQLVSEIRSLASSEEITALFTDALEHHLLLRKQTIALTAGFGAWKKERHPDLVTPEDTTAYVRAIREADKDRLAGLGDINGE